MRLADYIVTYSLQINSRCLRYLADCDHGAPLPGLEGIDGLQAEMQSVLNESVLARDSRRLLSIWRLIARTVGDEHPVQAHIREFTQLVEGLAYAPQERRLALRLAAVAGGDDEAQALLQLARRLPPPTTMTWAEISDAFTADSRWWRNDEVLAKVDDAELCERIGLGYRKAYRRAQAYAEASPESDWLFLTGARWHRAVQLATHQMELLRPGLSDKDKAQLWYLEKLVDTLRTRTGLVALKQTSSTLDLRASTAKLAVGHVDQQVHKMDKRLERLTQGSFGRKPKRFTQQVAAAVERLQLGQIRLMNPSRNSVSEQNNAGSTEPGVATATELSAAQRAHLANK